MDKHKQNFRVDSHTILEWINTITGIHNNFIEEKHFSAGFNICFLQQCMVEALRKLEMQEKSELNAEEK